MTELNAILAIAYRDLLKFLRDPVRIGSTFVLPFILIGILGGSFQSGLGAGMDFDFLAYIFTGVLAQTLFQSAAMGLVSVIEDRENDFSQEIFVSPISRYSIILGKIVGESLVASTQGIGIVLFGYLVGVSISGSQLLSLIPVVVVTCLFGGAFGVVIMANLKSQRAANQVFPFIILPQFFLAGVFNPIQGLPPYLDILSKIAPMRYPVDLTRGVFYAGRPGYDTVVVADPFVNILIMTGLFFVFLAVGTWLFVRNERNR
jgi:ABC-2 type transport system permease protein